MKKLVLVTGPPACGKTYVSRQLSRALRHVVYLDKDTLIVLSRQIFAVAGQPYDRSSDFFQKNIRDYEYEAIVNLALDALDYDDMVLINAPFTREIRDPAYMDALRARQAPKKARLVVVWLVVPPQICRSRMEKRVSDRDTWKLSHWDEYLKTTSFEAPKTIDDPSRKTTCCCFATPTTKSSGSPSTGWWGFWKATAEPAPDAGAQRRGVKALAGAVGGQGA